MTESTNDGARLRDLREARHVTREQVQQETGIGTAVLRDLERGDKDIAAVPLDTAAHLAHAIGVTLDELTRTVLDLPDWVTRNPEPATFAEARRECGYTHDELAKKAGATRTAIAEYENGRAPLGQLPLARAARLAQALHVNMDTMARWARDMAVDDAAAQVFQELTHMAQRADGLQIDDAGTVIGRTASCTLRALRNGDLLVSYALPSGTDGGVDEFERDTIRNKGAYEIARWIAARLDKFEAD
ncbi:MAG: helix-turn-helix transcriptional regulator [Bifidobacterium sp.]|nr:helix-turn-helix transcriptional regulator [Bifidobacterium sp.]